MKLKVLLIFLVLSSCNQKEQLEDSSCRIDYEFRSNFQNCIEIMALRELDHKIRFTYTGTAYYCLQTLTGHKSPIDTDSDTPFYYPYSEEKNYFVEDFKAWSNWYESNKCDFNMEVADSIFKSKQTDLTWPPFLMEVTLKDSSYVGY